MLGRDGTGVRGHNGGESDGYGSSDTDTDTASVLCLACSQFPFSFQYSAFPVYQPFFYSPCDLSFYQCSESPSESSELVGKRGDRNEGPLPPIEGSTEEGPGKLESTSRRIPLTDGTEIDKTTTTYIYSHENQLFLKLTSAIFPGTL